MVSYGCVRVNSGILEFIHVKMARKSLLDRPGSFSWCGVQNNLLLRLGLLELTQCYHHSAVFCSPLGSACFSPGADTNLSLNTITTVLLS